MRSGSLFTSVSWLPGQRVIRHQRRTGTGHVRKTARVIGSRKQVPHGMVPMSPHHKEAGLKAADLLQQRLGRCEVRLHDGGVGVRLHEISELHGEIGRDIRFAIGTLNADDASGFIAGQTEKLKCLKRAGNSRPPP